MSMKIPSRFYKMAVYRQPSSPTPTNTPLTLKAISGSPAVKIKVYEGNPAPISLSTSVNDGVWTAYTVGDTINLSLNDTVAFSGSTTTFNQYRDGTNAYKFEVVDGTVDIYGQVASLINFVQNCQYQNQFQRLFQNNNGDCSVRNASGLVLPSGLYTGCFAYMFQDNTELITPPPLLNTGWNGGWEFFYLFAGCSNLTSITVNFTTWSNNFGTEGWVDGVAENGTFYKPLSLSEEYGSWNIPNNWTVVDI